MKLCLPLLIPLLGVSAWADDASINVCGPPGETTYFVVNPPPTETFVPLTESELAQARHHRVAQLAERFRGSEEPYWVNLRSNISSRGVDTDTSVLVDVIPLSEQTSMGVLVISERHIVTYDASDSESATILDWVDLSDSWKESAYCREVFEGIRILENDAQQRAQADARK